SLLGQDYPNFHIFVVDNDSTDGSTEHLKRWCEEPRAQAHWADLPGVVHRSALEPGRAIELRITARNDAPSPLLAPRCGLTLVSSDANLGFAGGCNVGMLAAGILRFEYFWMLNTDAVVPSDSLRSLVKRALADPRVGIVGSTVRYYDRPDVI